MLYVWNQNKDDLSIQLDDEEKNSLWIVCQSDFDDMITEIKQVYVSSSYLGLYSWLLDRAFGITCGVRRNLDTKNNMTDNNRALLISVLYKINPQNLLKCFAKNVQK